MDKTYQTDLRRTFLIQGLPEPLKPAGAHLQIFDNYIEKTRMRLRLIRVPEENKWTWILQQRFPVMENDHSNWKIAQIYLNEDEYRAFESFKGREVRKNRYFYEYDERQTELDIYLGKLWGLNMMTVHFETPEEMESFQLPVFVIYEVTRQSFFTGENLVGKTFADVQREFANIQKALKV